MPSIMQQNQVKRLKNRTVSLTFHLLRSFVLYSITANTLIAYKLVTAGLSEIIDAYITIIKTESKYHF
jgi:hypothetical protein